MVYPNAAAGLKSMYQARLIALIALVLLIVPIVQIFAVAALLVAGFLALIGLYQCRKDDAGYRTAFMLTIVQLVLDLARTFLPEPYNSILSIVVDAVGLAILYYVCITTNRLLQEVGADEKLIDRGVVVWKLNLVCTVIVIVCQLLGLIPGDISTVIAGFVAIIALVAQIVGMILYLLYLRNAYRTLQAVIPPEQQAQQMM